MTAAVLRTNPMLLHIVVRLHLLDLLLGELIALRVGVSVFVLVGHGKPFCLHAVGTPGRDLDRGAENEKIQR
mgnify:CR=1 FL=1